MAAQMQININSGVSPDTKKLPPAQDVWESLQRRVSIDPSPLTRVSFDPSTLNVEVGDQIFWTNNDSQPHWPGLKNPADGSIDTTFFMPNQIAEVSDLGPSSSSIFSPGATGTLQYVCSLHCEAGQPCSEEGTIVVT
jgi:plastocyanin